MAGSKLIELMREQAKIQIQGGIELATVISPPPKLIIRVDNMPINLEGNDLIVCEHLLEHNRRYTTLSNISNSNMELAGYQSHTHKINSIEIKKQIIKLHGKLEKGDRLAVVPLPGGQQYLILDKVVEMK